MRKNKIFTMEYLWFILMVTTFLIFILETFRKGFHQSYIMLILSAISGLMYYARRAMRKNDEKKQL